MNTKTMRRILLAVAGLCGLLSWAVSGHQCAIKLLDMPRRVDYRLTCRRGRHKLHSVCGWPLQRSVYSSVCRVYCGIGNQHADCDSSHHMHGVCSGAVQCGVYGRLHSMSCRISDRYAVGCGSHDMHCLCGGPGECGVDRRLC